MSNGEIKGHIKSMNDGINTFFQMSGMRSSDFEVSGITMRPQDRDDDISYSKTYTANRQKTAGRKYADFMYSPDGCWWDPAGHIPNTFRVHYIALLAPYGNEAERFGIVSPFYKAANDLRIDFIDKPWMGKPPGERHFRMSSMIFVTADRMGDLAVKIGAVDSAVSDYFSRMEQAAGIRLAL